jgi:hypothetical protein
MLGKYKAIKVAWNRSRSTLWVIQVIIPTKSTKINRKVLEDRAEQREDGKPWTALEYQEENLKTSKAVTKALLFSAG